MNTESNSIEDKENWFGIKVIREKYSFERFRSLREKYVTENRKKIECLSFHNNLQFIELVEKQNALINELNQNEKLRASQNKEAKQLLILLRNLAKQDQKLFTSLIDHDSFLYLHKYILEHKNCSLELKHEALWNIAITSNFKLTEEKTAFLLIPVVSVINLLGELQRVDQTVFLEKILFSLTNFLIDYPSIGETLKNATLLQRFTSYLLSEHDPSHIGLALWFIRILLKTVKIAFEESLANYSIQTSLIAALKNYAIDKSLLYEILWTITAISEMNTTFDIIGFDLIMAVLANTVYNEETMVLPVLSILGNAFTSFTEDTIIKLIQQDSFTNLLQQSMLSTNFMVKREGLFLLSNMAAKSRESASYILQKADLVEFIFKIVETQEAYVYKEALYVIFNLCFSFEGFFYHSLRPKLESTLKGSNKECCFDEEIIMLENKFFVALTSN